MAALKPTVWPEGTQWNVATAKDAITCKPVWELSKPFIYSNRTAIDIGTRFGGFAHFLTKEFEHVHCFDIKLKKQFARNSIKKKVTHYTGPLGGKFKAWNIDEWRSGDGNNWQYDFKPEWLEETYNIDDHNFKEVDYIKIDTDGSEDKIIPGCELTIKEYKPLVVIEGFKPSQLEAIEILKSWGYKTVAKITTKNSDNVMMHESRL